MTTLPEDDDQDELPYEASVGGPNPVPEASDALRAALRNPLTLEQVDALLALDAEPEERPDDRQVGEGWAYEATAGRWRLHPEVRVAMTEALTAATIPTIPTELLPICTLVDGGFPELMLGTPDHAMAQRAMREGWLARNSQGELEPTAAGRRALFIARAKPARDQGRA